MIHVIATIKAREGQREVITTAFFRNLQTVRAKAGCIEYSLALNLSSGFPGQQTFDDNELIIVEKWSDLDALKAHIGDQAYQTWFAELWPKIAGASMQIFTALE